MFKREKKGQDAPLTDSLTIGVAVVNHDHKIESYNRSFYEMFKKSDSDDEWNEQFKDKDFYRVVGRLFFETGSCAPFYFASQTGETKTVTLVNGYSPTSGINPAYYRQAEEDEGESKNFEMFVSPYGNKFLVEVLDRSDNAHLEKRMQVLQNAGAELMSAIDRKLYHLPVEEQKEELKQIITEHMRETLRYDVVEIRIVGDDSVSLLPYLNFGVAPQNAARILKIGSNGQGITGYVADTGVEYICNDTENDPYYLEGAINAGSSITVPLLYDSQALGVINVERARVNDESEERDERESEGKTHKKGRIVPFTPQDALFLKLYAKDLAFALHLLHFSQLQREKARQVCADSIEEIRDKMDELFVAIHDLPRNVDDPDILAQKFDELSKDYFALKESYERTLNFVKSATEETIRVNSSADDSIKRLPSLEDSLKFGTNKKPMGQTGLVANYEQIKEFVSDRKPKFLIVTPQKRNENGLDQWLNELGATDVEIAPSTDVALNALRRGNYDFLYIHKYGDGGTGVNGGLYFSEKETSADAKMHYKNNKYGHCPLDIHRPGYQEPVEGDELDAQLRQRVAEALSSGKRDSFFFMRDLIDLNLSNMPTCIFTSVSMEYDGTHAYADMPAYLQTGTNRLLMLDFSGLPTSNTFVLSLIDAIRRREDYLKSLEQE